MSSITKIGKYLIRRELGKGAMGVVYEGFDPVIQRTVAIKTILPAQLAATDATDILARFKREAQAAGRLNHPGIVAVYDYGEVVVEDDSTIIAGADSAGAADAPIAFIAMEFVKGRELREYFDANERFKLADIARLMGEILAALGHAHSQGVVHRDMKPANLIVLGDGRVKIADFGIARIEQSELTQAGTVMGTPAYMSPEQFMGQSVDARSDLFSCGVILYQFLTGEKPFTGNNTTIMYKVLREEPLAPSMLNVTLSGAFDAVVKKSMAKAPDQRYQDAAEFAAAISAAADLAAEPGASNASATPTSAGNAPSVAPVETTGKKPGKALAATLAALALAVVGTGGYLFLGRSAGPSAPVAQNSTNPAPATPGAATPAATAAGSGDAPQEAGSVIISALGLVDPKDPRFKGDASAAQDEARADAKRQLIEKVLALYVEKSSLNKNYAVLEKKLLSQSGTFIKTVLQEGAPATGKDGLMEADTRAVVKVRDVQKFLNQLSKDERIDFIRNNGDPKVAIQMTVANADTAQNMAPSRSQLAENVLKERIKSFGFRVWSNEGEGKTGPGAAGADFLIQGEAKVKQLSAKLPASGLTITKTVLTSWTVKAVDKASGEEIYLNTITPKGQSWATEDQALSDIGRLMGEEFSKSFFLQHFNVGVRPTRLNIAGLPDAQTARLLLRELRGVRQVLDAQLINDTGRFQLQLAEGNATDIVQESILRPLNSKLGQNCFSLGGSGEAEISVTFASACLDATVRGKLETIPPAGLLGAPPSRGTPLLKNSSQKVLT